MVAIDRLASSTLLARASNVSDPWVASAASHDTLSPHTIPWESNGMFLSQFAPENWNLLRHTGVNGPYASHPGFGLEPAIPESCTIDKVFVLARHAERSPSTELFHRLGQTIEKIQRANPRGLLKFVSYHQWEMAADGGGKLTVNGRFAGTEGARSLGRRLRDRYIHLIPDHLHFFAAASGRVVESVRRFAAGFFDSFKAEEHYEVVLLSQEGSHGANSMTPDQGCRPFLDHHESTHHSIDFFDQYCHPILERLHSCMDDELTIEDLKNLFMVCEYELNMKGESEFCSLFSRDDWVIWGHHNNLIDYYGRGPGNPYSSAVGSVHLQAALSILSEETAHHSTDETSHRSADEMSLRSKRSLEIDADQGYNGTHYVNGTAQNYNAHNSTRLYRRSFNETGDLSKRSGNSTGLYRRSFNETGEDSKWSRNSTRLYTRSFNETGELSKRQQLDSDYQDDFDYSERQGQSHHSGSRQHHQVGSKHPVNRRVPHHSHRASHRQSENVFVSFAHNEQITTFLTAFGIFNPRDHLPTDTLPHPGHHNRWNAAELAPMGAYVALERLQCDCGPEPAHYVRLIVNDQAIPIPGCQSGPGLSCAIQQFETIVQERIRDYHSTCDCEEDQSKSLSFYWDRESTFSQRQHVMAE
uniref:ARAD1A10252p n=1 Tax=Blastobotrys adeninivorans TaxID=409370 RepID=A0A060SX33_BLAAD